MYFLLYYLYKQNFKNRNKNVWKKEKKKIAHVSCTRSVDLDYDQWWLTSILQSFLTNLTWFFDSFFYIRVRIKILLLCYIWKLIVPMGTCFHSLFSFFVIFKWYYNVPIIAYVRCYELLCTFSITSCNIIIISFVSNKHQKSNAINESEISKKSFNLEVTWNWNWMNQLKW